MPQTIPTHLVMLPIDMSTKIGKLIIWSGLQKGPRGARQFLKGNYKIAFGFEGHQAILAFLKGTKAICETAKGHQGIFFKGKGS